MIESEGGIMSKPTRFKMMFMKEKLHFKLQAAEASRPR